MTRTRASQYHIRRRDQLEALTSPARQEIVDGLQAIGPCSISTLAEALGRAPDSLYYHVRKLEEVGLLVPCGQTKAGRRDASVYDTPARQFIIDHQAIGPKARSMLIKAGSAMMRSAERELSEALRAGEPVTRNARQRRLTFGRIKARLAPRDLEILNGHLQAIAKLLAAGRDRAGGELFTFTFSLAPVRPARRNHRKTQ